MTGRDNPEGRRRRTGAAPAPAAGPDAPREIVRAADIYPHWEEITEQVMSSFVAHGREGGDFNAGVEETAFSRLVDRVCDQNQHWGVGPAQRAQLVVHLRNEFFGYGPLAPYMDIEGLEEILCNRYDRVFYIVHGQKKRMDPSPFRNEKDVRDFLSRVFAAQGRELTLSNPMEDGHLADGSRIHAEIPPLAVLGSAFAIRKFNPRPFTMEQYLETGMFTPEFLASLKEWVNGNQNIVISGGTASGKAQPLDALVLTPAGFRRMGEMNPGDEIIGADGQVHHVTGVFPQGDKPVFRITLSDGSRAESCDEHLWSVRHGMAGADGAQMVVPLADIRAAGVGTEGGPRWHVPVVSPAACMWWLPRPTGGLGALDARPERAIVSIEPVGEKPCRCISVSAPGGLYVTDDHVVTHNTTFINAVGSLIPKDDRLIVIENTKELQIETDDTLYIQAMMKGAHEGDGERSMTIRDGVRGALRLTPDRIIVGEVRSREALDLLQALNTGHDGSWTTIHANSAVDAISRLESLAIMADELPMDAIQDLIARAVDIVIQVGRFRGSAYRKVIEAWQVLHPHQVDPRDRQQLAAIRERGELQKLRNRMYALPLYTTDDDGNLVYRNDVVPVMGKRRPAPTIDAA